MTAFGTCALSPPQASAEDGDCGVHLHWLPLGAGGWFVRFNGRVFEAMVARREHRRPLDLYHCALELRLPAERYVIEVGPIPAGATRHGVVGEGPVGSALLARFRMFRYELRCWRDGVISDAAWAVASPQRLSTDPDVVARILGLIGSVPTPVWGRDELRAGEMWNSNSVVSWLLARSGLPTESIRPPTGGRAPGWDAGLAVARRQPFAETQVFGRLVRHADGRELPQPDAGARTDPPARSSAPNAAVPTTGTAPRTWRARSGASDPHGDDGAPACVSASTSVSRRV